MEISGNDSGLPQTSNLLSKEYTKAEWPFERGIWLIGSYVDTLERHTKGPPGMWAVPTGDKGFSSLLPLATFTGNFRS